MIECRKKATTKIMGKEGNERQEEKFFFDFVIIVTRY